eukprot:CAMPEP_0180120092 /NCGR_PEP_ID=MMETSP0986-20121125/2332_1 /TAXON_ID=697907 /ORGANISM="non described non described, Strain CCMP2293" /LENGTH=59 /DNA_ID=CAMNT_0022059139 /DNA_START=1 /DNA_END=176 /DNA_ORIENTATION=-
MGCGPGSGPVALAAVALQTANVRRASHLRKARFDASTSALAPLSASATSTYRGLQGCFA